MAKRSSGSSSEEDRFASRVAIIVTAILTGIVMLVVRGMMTAGHYQ